MPASLPIALIEALAEERCVPFVGAGISLNVLHPETKEPLFLSWRQTVERIAQQVRTAGDAKLASELEDATGASDYPRLLQASSCVLQVERWTAWLEEAFASPENHRHAVSLDLHRLIWDLNRLQIVTTNFDHCLSWACEDSRRIDNSNISELGPFLRGELGKPAVWHLHGEVHALDELIFLQSAYDALYGKEGTPREDRYAGVHLALDALLVHRHLLFLGYGLGDTAFLECLARVKKTLRLGAAQHYVVLPDTVRSTFESRGLDLEPIYYSLDPRSPRDHATPLRALLQRMIAARDRLRTQGFQRAIQAPWPQPARRYSSGIPLVLAFVSGKGGVGKTMLATAAALHLSESVETLLIDLDFSNRGLSDLAESAWQRLCERGLNAKACDLPKNAGNLGEVVFREKADRSWQILRAAPRLSVFSPRLSAVEQERLHSGQPWTLAELFRDWIDSLRAQTNAQAIVLDCHGAMDLVSLTAAVLARHTLLIVEPEPVASYGAQSFLELLNDRGASQEVDVRFIYNRVPPGFTRRQLQRDCEGRFRALAKSPRLLAAYPREDYLSRTLKRNPLPTRDYPDSALANRTRVWMRDLAGETSPDRPQWHSKLLEKSEKPNLIREKLARWSNGHLPFLLRAEMFVALVILTALIVTGANWANTIYLQNNEKQSRILHELAAIVAASGSSRGREYWKPVADAMRIPGAWENRLQVDFSKVLDRRREESRERTRDLIEKGVDPGEEVLLAEGRTRAPVKELAEARNAFEKALQVVLGYLPESQSDELSGPEATNEGLGQHTLNGAYNGPRVAFRPPVSSSAYTPSFSIGDREVKQATANLEKGVRDSEWAGIFDSSYSEKIASWRQAFLSIPVLPSEIVSALGWWTTWGEFVRIAITIGGLCFFGVTIQQIAFRNGQAALYRHRKAQVVGWAAIEGAIACISVACTQLLLGRGAILWDARVVKSEHILGWGCIFFVGAWIASCVAASVMRLRGRTWHSSRNDRGKAHALRASLFLIAFALLIVVAYESRKTFLKSSQPVAIESELG